MRKRQSIRIGGLLTANEKVTRPRVGGVFYPPGRGNVPVKLTSFTSTGQVANRQEVSA